MLPVLSKLLQSGPMPSSKGMSLTTFISAEEINIEKIEHHNTVKEKHDETNTDNLSRGVK